MVKKGIMLGLMLFLGISIFVQGVALGKKQEVTEAKGKIKVQKESQIVAEAKAIEPKLVMEYKFDEPIVDVIFGEATMTVKEARALGMIGLEQRKPTEKMRVPYPKGIVKEDRVDFYDKKVLINSIPLRFLSTRYGPQREKAIISNDGDYVLIFEPPKVGEYPSPNVRYVSRNGKVLWREKDCEWASELFGDSISPKGETVVLYKDGGSLRFLDKNGNLLNEYVFCKNCYDPGSWMGSGRFLKNGKYFVFACYVMKDENVVRKRSFISFFETESGKLIWEKEIPSDIKGCLEGMVTSSKGERIIVKFAGWGEDYLTSTIAAYGIDGNLIWRKDTNTPVREMAISSNGKILAVTIMRSRIDREIDDLLYMNAEDGRVIWRKSLPPRARAEEIIVSSQGDYVGLTLDQKGRTGIIETLLIDKNKNVIFSERGNFSNIHFIGEKVFTATKDNNKIKIFQLDSR